MIFNTVLVYLWWIIKENSDIENIRDTWVDNEKFSFDLDDIKLGETQSNLSIIETHKKLQEKRQEPNSSKVPNLNFQTME